MKLQTSRNTIGCAIYASIQRFSGMRDITVLWITDWKRSWVLQMSFACDNQWIHSDCVHMSCSCPKFIWSNNRSSMLGEGATFSDKVWLPWLVEHYEIYSFMDRYRFICASFHRVCEQSGCFVLFLFCFYFLKSPFEICLFIADSISNIWIWFC